MTRIRFLSLPLACLALAAASASADDVEYFEEGGIRYQRVRQVIQRPITETRYEQRESVAYRERYTTDMQEVQRTYQVPVTENQWVPGLQRTWNVLAPPVLTYRLMPVTRWETRTETVRIPVTKRELLPETRVQQVPVSNVRYAQEEVVRKIALGTVANGTSVARNEPIGGTSLESDPPREASSSSSSSSQIDRRR